MTTYNFLDRELIFFDKYCYYVAYKIKISIFSVGNEPLNSTNNVLFLTLLQRVLSFAVLSYTDDHF